MTSVTPNKAKNQDEALARAFANPILRVPGQITYAMRKDQGIFGLAKQLRDDWMWELPLLPGAVSAFIQMAVAREWTITGTPRHAAAAVDKLNEAMYVDPRGRRYYGWSDFSTRRILDWLTIGEVAFIHPFVGAGKRKRGLLQYVDPMLVTFNSKDDKHGANKNVIRSTTPPDTKDYLYAGENWGDDEIFFNHIFPVGQSAQVGPIFAALPTATLLALVNEHDRASLDGRKIRDIIVTADDKTRDALITAVTAAAALWNGADPAEHGVPITAANIVGGLGAGVKVADLFHFIGLSKLPDDLDRQERWFNAANEFSGYLGVEMRTWYNDPRGTNRSLEQVNMERQRVRGPAYFCRQEQRHINRTRILGRVHFAYIEEVDVSMEKIRAEVIKTMAEALSKLKEAIGDVVTGEALLTYLQRQGLFLNNADLLSVIVTLDEDVVKPQDMVNTKIEQLLKDQAQEEKEQRREREMESAEIDRDKQKIMQEAIESEPDIQRALVRFAALAESEPTRAPQVGEVTLDRNLNIIDRRRPMYPVAKLLIEDVTDDVPDEPDTEALVGEFRSIAKN